MNDAWAAASGAKALILFGAYEQGSGPSFLMALPEIAWEASLAVYCAWKGFRPSPIAETKVALA